MARGLWEHRRSHTHQYYKLQWQFQGLIVRCSRRIAIKLEREALSSGNEWYLRRHPRIVIGIVFFFTTTKGS
jgi:hypothetical protein